MSGQVVNELVGELVQTKVAEREPLETALGGRFQLADSNEHWSFYSVALPEGPFAEGEYRVSRAGDRALLSLIPRDPESVGESQIDFSGWGELQSVDVNPRIPPEGTDTLVFKVEDVQIRFQFTHHSRQLRTLSLRWGPVD